MDIQTLPFETALRKLEETIAQLEAGDLSLEHSLTLYEQGQALAAHCHRLLEQATLRVEQLTSDGEIVTVPTQNS